jgi:hypothetical protein
MPVLPFFQAPAERENEADESASPDQHKGDQFELLQEVGRDQGCPAQNVEREQHAEGNVKKAEDRTPARQQRVQAQQNAAEQKEQGDKLGPAVPHHDGDGVADGVLGIRRNLKNSADQPEHRAEHHDKLIQRPAHEDDAAPEHHAASGVFKNVQRGASLPLFFQCISWPRLCQSPLSLTLPPAFDTIHSVEMRGGGSNHQAFILPAASPLPAHPARIRPEPKPSGTGAARPVDCQ